MQIDQVPIRSSERPRCVLIVDDDEDLRDTLGDVFTSLGICSIKAGSLGALEARNNEVNGCFLALIDINLGPDEPNGLEVCTWLVTHGYPGHIVFMTGHAAGYPLVSDARAMRGIAILQKPIDLRLIEGMIEQHAP